MRDGAEARQEWAIRTVVEQFDARNSANWEAIYALESELFLVPSLLDEYEESTSRGGLLAPPPPWLNIPGIRKEWEDVLFASARARPHISILAPELYEGQAKSIQAVADCWARLDHIDARDGAALASLEQKLAIAKDEQLVAQACLRKWLGLIE